MRRMPRALHYWAVTPWAKENVILPYLVKDKHPAILERTSDRAAGSGRVVMFTTSFDYRPNEEKWNDYASTTDPGFLVALANETMKYLAGDQEDANFNYTSGQTLALPLPQTARVPEYTLDGPGVVGSDTRLLRGESDASLPIKQTDTAGNFVVSAATRTGSRATV